MDNVNTAYNVNTRSNVNSGGNVNSEDSYLQCQLTYKEKRLNNLSASNKNIRRNRSL